MFPGLYKSFDKYLLVHLLTQHDDTVRIKAYHADVTKKKEYLDYKCQTPGRGSAGP